MTSIGTYKSTFDFDFPPLHDPLAVAYVIDPSLFTLKLIHVDIETQSPFSRFVIHFYFIFPFFFAYKINSTSGQTICDMYGVTQREKNVRLAVKMDVPPFWALLAEAFKKADQVSPMNK